MTCQVPHTIRAMRDSDLGFCRDAWLRSMADAPANRYVPMAIFLRMQRDRVDRWLSQYMAHTYVATADIDHDLLLGFICAPEIGVVFYLYVKHDMRRMGLARALWQYAVKDDQTTTKGPVAVAHWGEACPSITRGHPSLMVYDPSLLSDPRRRQQRRPQLGTPPSIKTRPLLRTGQ